jgi:hypothetical protein
MSSDNIWCRLFGHKWTTWSAEKKLCDRCDAAKHVDLDRVDEDQNAEAGDVRISVREDHDKYRVEVERYQECAWSKDSVHLQWMPSQSIRIGEDGLRTLFEETADALDLTDRIEVNDDN